MVDTTNGAASSQEQAAPELSVEQRFANAMGIEDDPTAEQEQAQEQEASAKTNEAEVLDDENASDAEPETVELEINGELYEVPKELKDGYLRQQDYTRKTQELAVERQTIQEQRQAVEAERQAVLNQAQAYQQNFQIHAQVAAIDQQIAQYSQVDWQQLVENDPVEAMKLDKSLRDLKDMRNGMVQQAIATQQQMDYAQQQQIAALIQEGKQRLSERIPNWSPEVANSLREYGSQIGFSADELNGIYDPRHVEVLHKAFLYDQLQAGKPGVLNKVSQAPKTLQKGAQVQKQSRNEVLKKIVRTSTNKQTKHDAIQQIIASRM